MPRVHRRHGRCTRPGRCLAHVPCVWYVAGAENGGADAQFKAGRPFLAGEIVRFDLERTTEMLFAADAVDTRLYAGMIGEALSYSLPIIAENAGEHEVGPYASISLLP
ncbi:MAG: hypothetical protein GDA49_05380 [Rhodospirillales bacterium]|nr:hypothetical protein [Rhodospirillales bacterium]